MYEVHVLAYQVLETEREQTLQAQLELLARKGAINAALLVTRKLGGEEARLSSAGIRGFDVGSAGHIRSLTRFRSRASSAAGGRDRRWSNTDEQGEVSVALPSVAVGNELSNVSLSYG